MSKLLSISIAALLSLPGFSGEFSLLPPAPKKGGQQWIVIGLRGSINNTWLMNSNVMNDKGIKMKPSFGGGGGIMLGIHLSELIAIEPECVFTLINQKYASKIDSSAWTSKTSLAYLEFPILLRFDFETFKYLELGVKFASLKTAKDDFSSSTFNYSATDDIKNYEKGNTSLIFGWGTGLWGNGGLMVNFGIRATYGLSDIVSLAGGKDDPYWSYGETAAKGYKPTNTATIGFQFNVDFDLGWFMSSSCGRSHKFVLFGH